ncbi:MAG: tyrosine-protein phosphatase [Phycisphaerales bacterium]
MKSQTGENVVRRGRAWAAAVLVLALIGASGWFYRYHVRDNIFPKNFGVVDEGKVYRAGGLTPAAFRAVAAEHGIKTFVDLGAWPAGSAEDRRAQRTAEALGVKRFRLELVGDGTGNPNHYVNTLRIMTDPARQPVLVHCGAGSERTGIAVILYRNLTLDTPIDEAYKETQRYKHRPTRNPKLKEVLARFAEPILAAYRDGSSIVIPGEVEPVPVPKPVADAAPAPR